MPKKASKKAKKQSGQGFFRNLARAFGFARKTFKPVIDPVVKSGVIGNLVAGVNPNAGAVVKAAGLGRRQKKVRVAKYKARMAGGGVISENQKVLAF